MPNLQSSVSKQSDIRWLWLTILLLVISMRIHAEGTDPISVKSELARSAVTSHGWGTFEKPFSADSLWNSRPVGVTFGSFEIPKSNYFPAVGTGPYSSAVFLSDPSDPPLTIHPAAGKSGIWDPDAGELRSTVTIQHWPASVIPAEGNDGHADVIDIKAGIVHSFFHLKNNDGHWTAGQYAWSPLKGTGWGDPAHYFKGARAAGVSTTAGLIRKHEIDDGQPIFQHALAMSLTYNALSPKPTYIYPATSADTGAEKQNFGQIPEGALMMLPPDFDLSKITSLPLRKVAATLQTYGAYVVDRNVGTPFVIYVENGSGFSLHRGGWDVRVASDLDRIRAALRQVISVQNWVDGNGRQFTPFTAQKNVLSMRGPWVLTAGTQLPVFDTQTQALNFSAPTDGKPIAVSNSNSTGLSHVTWAKIIGGTSVRFTVNASGAAKLRLIVSQGAKQVVDSRPLGNGQSLQFDWPADGWITLVATSDPATASSVSAELVPSAH